MFITFGEIYIISVPMYQIRQKQQPEISIHSIVKRCQSLINMKRLANRGKTKVHETGDLQNCVTY